MSSQRALCDTVAADSGADSDMTFNDTRAGY